MQGLFIQGLEAQARVGVEPDESDRTQPIEIDVEVALDAVATAAHTEQLRDTLDYRCIAKTVSQVVDRRHYPLVETLATAIAKALLLRPEIDAVRVRLHKLKCIPGAQAAGVEISLHRSQLDDPIRPLTRASIVSAEAIVIVGGGVAGLSAALWCWRLGHPALLVEPAARLGGQLQLVHFKMCDLPGQQPLSGPAFAHRISGQFARHGGRWFRGDLLSVTPDPRGYLLQLKTPDGISVEVGALALIVASGLRRRQLGAPGEDRLAGRGVLETASRGISQTRGDRVLVVGGGDSACENALKLAAAGARVTLAYRRAELSARLQLRRRVTEHDAITLSPETQVSAFVGDNHLEAVTLHDGRTLPLRWALVRIGWLPNSEALPADWLDDRGYLRCGADLSVVGQSAVFGAGDIRNPAAPSVASAAGDGAGAAKSVVCLLERSALDPGTDLNPALR